MTPPKKIYIEIFEDGMYSVYWEGEPPKGKHLVYALEHAPEVYSRAGVQKVEQRLYDLEHGYIVED